MSLKLIIYYAILVLILIKLVIYAYDTKNKKSEKTVKEEVDSLDKDKEKREYYKQFKRGTFWALIISAIILVPLFYFYNKKLDEDSAERLVRSYANQINGFKSDNDNLNNYFPRDYIDKNINNIGTVVNFYSARTQGEIFSIWRYESNTGPFSDISFKSNVSYVEKCNTEDVKKDIAINYGSSLDLKCAYTVYVYYETKGESHTIPIIAGKIGDTWYIVDDFDENGLIRKAYVNINNYSNTEGNYENGNTDKIDDKYSTDRTSVVSELGDFVYDPNGRMSEEQKNQVEEYLISKYEETGVRMYIVFSEYDNKSDIDNQIDNNMLNKATSPAMAYSRSASDNTWVVRWIVPDDHSQNLKNNYEQIANAYFINGSYYDRLKNVIDKAYELY